MKDDPLVLLAEHVLGTIGISVVLGYAGVLVAFALYQAAKYLFRRLVGLFHQINTTRKDTK